MEKNLEKLIESAKLTGRVDLLMEIRNWLNELIAGAEKENERLREQLQNKT